LVTQVQTWQQYFQMADADRSGKLNQMELLNCLRHFGYNFGDMVHMLIFNAYDGDASGRITFDEFIQVLAELSSLTGLFRAYDPAGTGRATLDYATFMQLVFSTRS
jgi:Ca2+-binding EF-hand superfamily protein